MQMSNVQCRISNVQGILKEYIIRSSKFIIGHSTLLFHQIVAGDLFVTEFSRPRANAFIPDDRLNGMQIT
jgi:hypothetical protein